VLTGQAPSASRSSSVFGLRSLGGKCAACLGGVGIAAGGTALFWAWLAPSPSLLFFPAIIAIALYAGLWPALLGTALSTAVLAYFFLPPFYSFKVDPADFFQLGAFVVTTLIVTSVTGARRRAEESLRELSEDLERRIAARTAELSEMHTALEVSRRLEAIGHLAGGIAHDFNNLLTIMIGNAEMLADEVHANDRARAMVAEIQNAATRGALLTRQLLAYARRQHLQWELVSLNVVIETLLPLIQHLSPDAVMVELRLAPALPVIRADRGQIEQVIMNVCTNACHAMPEGGTLTVTTAVVRLDTNAVKWIPDVRAGTFVRLDVRDTGTGMDSETAIHALEPFFTTKGVGQGTGLGLSTAHGIIKQTGGEMSIQTAPEQGTTVTIHIPVPDS
jgi:signal transduction histidine kinase